MYLLIDTCFLYLTVFEIFAFKVCRLRPWPFSLYRTIFEIFAFKVCRLRPWPFSLYRTVFEIFNYKIVRAWPLTFRGHLRSKIFLPFESPYMTSYLTSIDTFYLVPFLRYLTSTFLGFDLDFWSLKVTWGQKYFCHSKANIWLPI